MYSSHVVLSKLLGAVDDLMHYCTRSQGVIVYIYYKQAWNTCFLPNPFDEILSSVPWMELLWTMRFCCRTENFTKSAQFWSQNVPLVLTKKNEYPHFMFLTINNGVIGVLSCQTMLHNVSFHKLTVHASLSRMSISACVFLTGKQVTRPWYSASQ